MNSIRFVTISSIVIFLFSLNASGNQLWLTIFRHDHDQLKALLKDAHIRKYQLHEQDDVLGWTPLHIAIEQGCTHCIKILLNAGADPRVIDHAGDTILGLVHRNPDHNQRGHIIYRLLEAWCNRPARAKNCK